MWKKKRDAEGVRGAARERLGGQSAFQTEESQGSFQVEDLLHRISSLSPDSSKAFSSSSKLISPLLLPNRATDVRIWSSSGA